MKDSVIRSCKERNSKGAIVHTALSLQYSLSTENLFSVVTRKYVSQDVHNSVSNVFHLPAVNQRIERRIEKHRCDGAKKFHLRVQRFD